MNLQEYKNKIEYEEKSEFAKFRHASWFMLRTKGIKGLFKYFKIYRMLRKMTKQ